VSAERDTVAARHHRPTVCAESRSFSQMYSSSSVSGLKVQRKVDGPRPAERLCVFERHAHVQVSEITARERLGYAKGLGVREAGGVQPGPVIKASRFNNQRFTLPAADRVAVPGGLRVDRQRTAIDEDLPKSFKSS